MLRKYCYPVMAVLFVVSVLAGCGGNSSDPVTNVVLPQQPQPNPQPAGSTPTSSGSRQQPGLVLYVGTPIFTEDFEGSVSAFHVDPQSGVLTELPDSPFAAFTNIAHFLPAGDGHFMFIAKNDFFSIRRPGDEPPPPPTAGLYRVPLDSSGAFKEAPIRIRDGIPTDVDPAQKYVFAQDSDRTINTYTVDPKTGDLALVPGSGVSFSQDVAFIGLRETRLWVQLDPNNLQQSTFQAVDIDSATGKLAVDPRQFVRDIKDVGAIEPTPFGLLELHHPSGAPGFLTVYTEQPNGFVKVQTCTRDMFLPCDGGQPIVHPSGKFIFFGSHDPVTNKAIFLSVPIDPVVGLVIKQVRVYDADPDYRTFVISEDGKLLYTVSGSLVSGFRIDDTGGLTRVPGSPVSARNGGGVALALGKTQ